MSYHGSQSPALLASCNVLFTASTTARIYDVDNDNIIFQHFRLFCFFPAYFSGEQSS